MSVGLQNTIKMQVTENRKMCKVNIQSENVAD